VLGEIGVDGALQIDDRAEGATTDALAGHFGKEALNRVEPGGGGRGEPSSNPLSSSGESGELCPGASRVGRRCLERVIPIAPICAREIFGTPPDGRLSLFMLLPGAGLASPATCTVGKGEFDAVLIELSN
jgi:hypothetical protein